LLYGSEYEENILASDSADEDVPCAVCRSTMTETSIMIPGREACYPIT
jgi:cytidine deaminase